MRIVNLGAQSIHARLSMVYLAIFLQGFVLWYNIEKLFMQKIGFGPATTAVAITILSFIIVCAEVPSGILADRWSRTGVLMVAGGILALASIIGGLSRSIGLYLVASGLHGLFLAFCTGTSDSLAYDICSSERRSARETESALGMLRMAEGAGLIGAALLGGLAASHLGPRSTYWLTIIPAVTSIAVLLLVQEPRHHAETEPLRRHFWGTIRAVCGDRQSIPITALLIVVAVLTYAYLDLAALWLLELQVPISWFGPIVALLLLGYGLGGILGPLLGLSEPLRFMLASVALVLACIDLAIGRSAIVIVAGGALLVTLSTALTVVLTRLLHDGLAQPIRAGASSLISLSGRVVQIPLVLTFGWIAQRVSVFHAAWLLVGTSVVAALIALRATTRARDKAPDLTHIESLVP